MSSSNQAQYAIDIAARMTGMTHTSAQLDELTATLTGAGRGAEHFELAIAKLTGELSSVKTASAAANAALGIGTDEYRQLEKSAMQASKAVERAALRNKGLVPADLQAKLTAANAALAAQASTLRGLESNAASASAKEAELARTLGNVRVLSAHADKSLNENAERLSQVRGALGNLSGPLGQLGSRVLGPAQGFSILAKSVGTSRASMLLAAAAIAALIVGVVALTAKLISSAIATAQWAVRLADGVRQVGLTRDAFAALSPAMGAAQASFDAITAATGQGDDQLRALTKSLIAAKVSTAQLPAALNAAATAEAALGQGGAQQFIDQIAAGTLTVNKFATTVQDKFGGIVARQMLGLEAQGARLKYNFSAIFGGLNIEPALSGMSRLVGLFDKDSASGQALSLLFGKIFQPFIDQADSAATSIEAFFLGIEIGFMKIYLASRPTFDALGDFAKTLLGIDSSSLSTWKERGEALAGTIVTVAKWAAILGGGLLALGAVIGLAVTAVVALVGALAALVVGIGFAIGYGLALLLDGIKWLGEAIGNLVYNGVQALLGLPQAFVNMGKSVIDWFSSFSLVDLGVKLIAGLVSGIVNSAGAVVNAIGGAVQGAINKAKSLLGIASPSKVFAMIGQRTGEGFASGVDESSDQATSAMSSLVSPPTSALSAFDALSGNLGPPLAAPAAAPAAVPAASGGGASVNLAGAQITFNGVQDGPSGVKQFGDWLTQCLEGDAAQIGAAATAGAT